MQCKEDRGMVCTQVVLSVGEGALLYEVTFVQGVASLEVVSCWQVTLQRSGPCPGVILLDMEKLIQYLPSFSLFFCRLQWNRNYQ